MTRHPGNLGVASRGCDALAYLTQGHPQNAAAAVDAGAVAAALAAMRAFPAAVEVQGGGCLTLSNIIHAAGTLRGAHADGAAADAAVAAMRAHAGDSRLQMHCCDLLAHLFFNDRNADAAWMRRGGAVLTLATAALRAHRQDVEVLTAGCVVITRLMINTKENQRAVGVSGAIKAVVAAMRAFPAAAELQLYGCNALGNTCHNARDNQLAAAAAGGLEVTVSAMRTHAANENVHMTGCIALGALVADEPPSQTRAGELGGVEAMVAALRARAVPLHAESADFFKCWGISMLQLLHEHTIHTHKAVAAGTIELLVAHMSAPETVPLVFEWACSLMARLVSGTGCEARAVLAGALEALEAQHVESAFVEGNRLRLIRGFQPAAQRHDAAPCAVAGCKRCAAARDCGAMCALPGCGARGRPDGKKLLRCGTCRAACYCSAAHQREDWGRHKGQCGAAVPRDDDAQAAGVSGC
jgi:hypothetical protein